VESLALNSKYPALWINQVLHPIHQEIFMGAPAGAKKIKKQKQLELLI
jgi:hypothetical protein